MPIPPDPILRAAARWLEHAPNSGEQHTRSLLTTNFHYSDLTPTQYETALTWLRGTGLLEEAHADRRLAGFRIFECAIQDAPWFLESDLFVRELDELPIDAVRAAAALGLSPKSAFNGIRIQWGKVDAALREAVGAAGELAVLQHLRERLSGKYIVDHVAQLSDGLGFDISVAGPGLELHLEVKSTTRPGRPTFYLSRNEFEVSHWDSSWVLVLARLSKDFRLRSLEGVDRGWIWASAPLDAESSARWESARFQPPDSSLTSAIPWLDQAAGTGSAPADS